MRHVIGVALAIVLAAAVFFAASWGYLKLLIGPARGGVLPGAGGSLIHDHAVLEGFGALLAVGLLAGILMALPVISPLASGLPGLALLALTGLYLCSVRRAVQYIPLKSQSYGTGFEAMLFDGVLALAGLAMIMPLLVPSRWRRRAAGAAGPAPCETASAAFADLEATQTMAGGGLLSDWAQTRPLPRLDPGRAQAPWDTAEAGSPPDYSSPPSALPASGGPQGVARARGRFAGAAAGPTVRTGAQAAWNCSDSVEPASATVSAFGEMAEVTRSK